MTLRYKDVRVSPSSQLGGVLIELQNPKLAKDAREFLTKLAERIYQDCEREYRKHNP
ncbi:hypothetical protein ACPUER_12085 [Burkholderia sp. DN3021]|uniref:hypothetical protein n=1 Tax=Burkholderia sp. DN3021 TaxID=3410137 RepID=UPI003C7B3191